MEQENIDDMFSQMLGELDDLTQQLDAVPQPDNKSAAYASKSYLPPPPSTDTVDDVNLAAMLDDLQSFEQVINEGNQHTVNFAYEDHFDATGNQYPQTKPITKDEPKSPFVMHRYVDEDCDDDDDDDDDEFSLEALSKDIDLGQQQSNELTEEELAALSPEEREEKLKSEKVRIALEKMKEARIQKLVVKVYNKDDSSKTMVIDERMSVRVVMKQLIEKNHFDFSPNWALIEELPSMYLERMFEEHEKPCETMKYWTRDTTNQLRFIERKDKYALFKNPQHFLLSSSDQQEQMQERQKQLLIEEFFSGKGPSSAVPEVEGYLHIKSGKSWSRKYCLLRSSGLYVSKGGEPKKGKKGLDLSCLVMFEQANLYIGRSWKKRFKSPFEYGFALKHPAIQVKSKHVRYLACEDFKSFIRWIVGIRLAKYGSHLLRDYERTNDDARAASSVPSMTFRPEQADSASLRSSDSGEGGSQPSSLPRAIGVKNIFGGAWKRANEEEQTSMESASGMNRTKSTWKPNAAKKTNNWWELQEGESEESGDQTPSQIIDDIPIPAQFPTTDLPPPPPDGSFPPTQDSMPPPPPFTESYIAPASTQPSSTFTSFDDPLPPPPPTSSYYDDGPSKNKLPPPLPKKIYRSPQHNYTNNNSNLSYISSAPLCETSGIDTKPPPMSTYYINQSSHKDELYTLDDLPPPPTYLLDLKESFDAVSEDPSKSAKMADRAPPHPRKLISYIKARTISRIKGNRKPPPPLRSASTRLSRR